MSPDPTAALTAQFPHISYRPLADTGAWVSAAGFGGYRVEADNPDHLAALRHALRGGINLIDTSANYSDGGSETAVGQIVAEGILPREQLIIVSKAGYLQGQNYALSQQMQAEGRPFPDLVHYSTGLEHCLHPDFLADQLTRSLGRLGLAQLDVFLLHNPEYYLSHAKQMDIETAEARPEYERRLALAFTHLEQEVAHGRIRWYGVSSNTLPSPADSYEHTSLARLAELAREVGGAQNQFKVVQLPFNLLERGAAEERNQPHGRTTLEVAQELGLAVLVNRPLNAIQGHDLIRLADVPPITPPAVAELEAAVAVAAEREEQLQQAIFTLPLPFRTLQEFSATLASARLLRQRWAGFGSLSNWQDVRDGYVSPRVALGLDFLRRRPEATAEALATGEAYGAAVQAALGLITAHYQALAAVRADEIRAAVPAFAAAPTLSQAAVRFGQHTPGVTAVLVGMRRVAYVADVLGERGDRDSLV